MYRITIKGQAKTEYPYLHELNGIQSHNDEENYVEYLHDDSIKQKLVHGFSNFVYDKTANVLYVVVTYLARKKLTKFQLQRLMEYTRGQWSDGIGEVYEQFPCYQGSFYTTEDGETTKDVYISMWYKEQPTPEVVQTKI